MFDEAGQKKLHGLHGMKNNLLKRPAHVLDLGIVLRFPSRISCKMTISILLPVHVWICPA